uniref:Uncharacterized protein n=1 Tax=Glossina palpalis gambiensis TaxID=67801 RepID=A0A1B0BR25_9MUSC
MTTFSAFKSSMDLLTIRFLDRPFLPFFLAVSSVSLSAGCAVGVLVTFLLSVVVGLSGGGGGGAVASAASSFVSSVTSFSWYLYVRGGIHALHVARCKIFLQHRTAPDRVAHSDMQFFSFQLANTLYGQLKLNQNSSLISNDIFIRSTHNKYINGCFYVQLNTHISQLRMCMHVSRYYKGTICSTLNLMIWIWLPPISIVLYKPLTFLAASTILITLHRIGRNCYYNWVEEDVADDNAAVIPAKADNDV